MVRRVGKARVRDAAPLFAALGDPTRLALVVRLSSGGPESISRLSESADVSRQAVTKHLDILVAAGLVTKRAQGRNRLHALCPEPLREVEDWLAPYAAAWDERLKRLRFHLHGED